MADHDAFEVVMARRHAPLRVGISGAGGAGRRTLAAALRRHCRVDCTVLPDRLDAHDCDVVIVVIGASVRRRDRDAIAAVGVPVVVAATKADTRTDPEALAAAAARELGLPVCPVVSLVADGGILPLGRALAAAATQVAVRRDWQVQQSLRVLAARGEQRDRAEALLSGVPVGVAP